MNNPTPSCPYCGAVMALNQSFTCARYECRECGANSPYVSYDAYGEDVGAAKEEAYAAAMQRWQEPNRVLTADDLREMEGDPHAP